jgi:hypothetical protein
MRAPGCEPTTTPTRRAANATYNLKLWIAHSSGPEARRTFLVEKQHEQPALARRRGRDAVVELIGVRSNVQTRLINALTQSHDSIWTNLASVSHRAGDLPPNRKSR